MSLARQPRVLAAVVATAAVVSIAAELLGLGANPVRLVCGLVLVTFGTGYALLDVLLPAEEYNEDHVNRLWWSIPSSFVVAILVGVVLDLSPLGLAARPFVLTLGGTTLGLLGLALLTERRRSRADRGTDASRASNHWRRKSTGAGCAQRRRQRGSHPGRVWLLFIVPLLAGSLLWAVLGIIQAARTQPKPFTALALEGDRDIADATGAWIVIANREGRRTEYDLEIRSADGATVRWEAISLEAGADWRSELPVDQLNHSDELTVTLFLHGHSEPYRTLRVRP